MFHHSYGRPREAIRLVSLCIAEAQRKGRQRVDEEDLDAGILKFSDSRISEIASEFSYQYGGLDHIIRKFLKWPKEFPVKRLKEITETVWLEIEYGEEFAKEYRWAGGFTEDVSGFARVLLECGILLYKPSERVEPSLYDLDKK